MAKHRVYQYYVGCYVYDVEAQSPEEARRIMEKFGARVPGVEFLHEANDAHENVMATEIYRYDANGDTEDEPSHSSDEPGCEGMLAIWRGQTHPKLAKLIEACQQISRFSPKSEPPEPTERDRDDVEPAEKLQRDHGAFCMAEIARAALREIGVEPVEGTTEWYHEEEPADA